jgi:hypothetical protein
VTTVFRREVAENCALLGYYAASSGSFFSFLGGGSVLVSWTLRMEPICCPETSVRNCHYSLRNNQKSAVLKNTKKFTIRPRNIPDCYVTHESNFYFRMFVDWKERITIIKRKETFGLQPPKSYKTRIPKWRSAWWTLQKKPSNFRTAAAQH